MYLILCFSKYVNELLFTCQYLLRRKKLHWPRLIWPTRYIPYFKITIIQLQITWKWYNIELCLQWPTNRKSYRNAPFSMTLNDPYPPISRSRHFWCWISQKRYDIQILFEWNTNRDLHAPYSTVLFPFPSLLKFNPHSRGNPMEIPLPCAQLLTRYLWQSPFLLGRWYWLYLRPCSDNDQERLDE